MLRVTTSWLDEAHVILKVEGSVTTEAVPELEKECRRWLKRGTSVRLDFGDVQHVDARAAHVLHALARDGATIVNCPSLVRDLLDLNRR